MKQKNPILPQKQFSSVKHFWLWVFLFCFYTSVFSHVGVPLISQIITGYVLGTVVEHMNILSVLHDLQCLVFSITIQERVPIRTFRHSFLSDVLCP